MAQITREARNDNWMDVTLDSTTKTSVDIASIVKNDPNLFGFILCTGGTNAWVTISKGVDEDGNEIDPVAIGPITGIYEVRQFAPRIIYTTGQTNFTKLTLFYRDYLGR